MPKPSAFAGVIQLCRSKLLQDHGAIGISFASDWLTKWCEFFFFNQSGLMEAKQKSNLEFFSITNWYLLFCSRLRRYIRSDGKHHLGQIRKCFLRPVAQLRALWLVYARRFPFPGFKFPLLTVCTEEEAITWLLYCVPYVLKITCGTWLIWCWLKNPWVITFAHC